MKKYNFYRKELHYNFYRSERKMVAGTDWCWTSRGPGVLSRGSVGTPLGTAGMILFIRDTREVTAGLQGVQGPQGGLLLESSKKNVISEKKIGSDGTFDVAKCL